MLENNQKENLLLEIGYKEPEFIMDLGMSYPKEGSRQKRRYGLYVCPICNKEFKGLTSSIKNKKVHSCGCLRNKMLIERNTTHCLRKHRLYGIWNGIIQRCTNEKSSNYLSYGFRGITVCESWLNIENFIEDMNDTFQEGLSIDRIDNNLGYSKENCRWATKSTQTRNTRKICSKNTSGYRGVDYLVKNKKFRARITINYKEVHLGCFDTSIEAAYAYDKYVIDNNLEHTMNFK